VCARTTATHAATHCNTHIVTHTATHCSMLEEGGVRAKHPLAVRLGRVLTRIQGIAIVNTSLRKH